MSDAFEGLDDLAFEPCPVRQGGAAVPEIKVAVLAKAGVKLSLNADAFEKLGQPKALAVTAARKDGVNFLRLSPADEGKGWPVMSRAFKPGRRLSAACTLGFTPHDPGVVHAAHLVEAHWGVGDHAHVVTIALPDWSAMREEVGL